METNPINSNTSTVTQAGSSRIVFLPPTDTPQSPSRIPASRLPPTPRPSALAPRLAPTFPIRRRPAVASCSRGSLDAGGAAVARGSTRQPAGRAPSATALRSPPQRRGSWAAAGGGQARTRGGRASRRRRPQHAALRSSWGRAAGDTVTGSRKVIF